MTDDKQVPVLIIGAGPVGLGTAIQLGRRGIDCVVVEQGDGTIYHPRANTVNSRTMEFCRQWGIADAVRNAGAPADFSQDILYLTGMQGYPIAHIERPAYGGDKPLPTTPERSQRCNQLFFDPVLRTLVESFPSVELRYQTRFEDFEITGDGGVHATVRDLESDTTEIVQAQYLVSCCGGNSMVPNAIGSSMEGRHGLFHSLNVFLRIPEFWSHHPQGNMAFYFFVGNEGPARSLIELDGKELWRLGLSDRQQRFDIEKTDIDGIIRDVIGHEVPHELISALPWTCHSIVADKWIEGPVYLAGDAVHQHSPAGGFGMNTGMGDAYSLGWILAAQIEGWGGPGLAAAYQAERRPVAQRNVRAATKNIEDRYEDADPVVLRADSDEGAAARQKLGDRIVREKTHQFVSHGIALGYIYEASPIICADGTPPPPDSIGDYTPTSRPGSRAPHAWIDEDRSTIDLFGDGFTLLRFSGDDAGNGLAAAAAAVGMPFQSITVDDAEVAALYERNFVLVRPDGHVAWRSDTPPDDPARVIDHVRGMDV